MNDRTNLLTKAVFILKPGFSTDKHKLPITSKCKFGIQPQKVKVTCSTLLLKAPFAFENFFMSHRIRRLGKDIP